MVPNSIPPIGTELLGTEKPTRVSTAECRTRAFRGHRAELEAYG